MARYRPVPLPRPPEPLSATPIYVSYSRRDVKLVDEFLAHAEQVAPHLRFFRDLDIRPGAAWDRQLRTEMARASGVVFFLSPDALGAEYIWNTEVPIALLRLESEGLVVLPVLLRACDWKATPLAQLQMLPRSLQPIGGMRDRRVAWQDLIDALQAPRQAPAPNPAPPPVVSAPPGADRLRLALYAVLGQPADFELLERLDAASLAAAWRGLDGPGRTPEAVFAELEKRHGRVEPHPLWAAWVATVQPDKLGS